MPPRKPRQKGIVQAKTIQLELNCEWGDCYDCFDKVDDILAHLSDHLKEFLHRVGEEISGGQDVAVNCRWRDCGCQLEPDSSAISRHVLFHAFHAKIKYIGQKLIERMNLSHCTLDSSGRNMIPELPESLACGWENCGCVYDNPEYFYRHVDTHIEGFEKGNKPDSSVRCYWEGCQHALKSRHKLKDHLRSHSQEKVVACPTCGSLFANNTKFEDHVIRQADSGNTYQCSHCNRRYSTERLLRDHMRHHVNHYKCPLCDMTCPSPSALKLHMRYRHTDVKPFECDQCNFSCKMLVDLNKHMESHTAEPYKCSADDCNFEGKNFTSLSNHFRLVHQKQKPTMYKCHLCKQEYKRGYHLTQHLKKKHNFKWPSGHIRFRYKLHDDGYMRLQTVRYESVDVTVFNKDGQEQRSQQQEQVLDMGEAVPEGAVEMVVVAGDTGRDNGDASQMNIDTITAMMEGQHTQTFEVHFEEQAGTAEYFIQTGNEQGDQALNNQQIFIQTGSEQRDQALNNQQICMQTGSEHGDQAFNNQQICMQTGSERGDQALHDQQVFIQTGSEQGDHALNNQQLVVCTEQTSVDSIAGTDGQETYNLQMLGEVALHLPQPEQVIGAHCPVKDISTSDDLMTNTPTNSLDMNSAQTEKLTGAKKRKSPMKKLQSKKRKLDVGLDDDHDIENTVRALGINITN